MVPAFAKGSRLPSAITLGVACSNRAGFPSRSDRHQFELIVGRYRRMETESRGCMRHVERRKWLDRRAVEPHVRWRSLTQEIDVIPPPSSPARLYVLAASSGSRRRRSQPGHRCSARCRRAARPAAPFLRGPMCACRGRPCPCRRSGWFMPVPTGASGAMSRRRPEAREVSIRSLPMPPTAVRSRRRWSAHQPRRRWHWRR